MVWEMVLIEDDTISTTSPYTPPGLLAVNRQIRTETITTYYSCNAFRLYIQDFNVKAAMPAIDVIQNYHDPPANVDPATVGIVFAFDGDCKWNNLRYSIKAIFQITVNGITEAETGDQVGQALVGLFEVVDGLIESGATWKHVKSALPGLRKMMALSKEDWLVD